jgi:hypothetical protein
MLAGCGDGTDPGGDLAPTQSGSQSFTSSTGPTVAETTNQTLYDGFKPLLANGGTTDQFVVPAGTVRLTATVSMNTSGDGAYLLYGLRGAPPMLLLTQEGEEQASFTFKQVASTSNGPGTFEGPYEIQIDAPTAGDWLIELNMAGSNVRAVVLVTAEVAG